MHALVRAGVNTKLIHHPQKKTEAMEVVSLMLRYAEALDGRTAINRRDVYRDVKHARDVVEKGAGAVLTTTRESMAASIWEAMGEVFVEERAANIVALVKSLGQQQDRQGSN